MLANLRLVENLRILLRRLGRTINKWALVGTEGYPPDTQQRLRIVNIAAYLIVAVTLNYTLLHIVFDVLHHTQIVIANLMLVPIALSVPFLHRYHDHAGVLVLYAAEFIVMFYLISQMGRDSGVQINYIGFAAGAFLGIHHERIRLILFIILMAFILSTAAWFLYPAEKAGVTLEPALLANIYTNSAFGTVGIVAFVVYYAFTQVHLAKAETDRLLRNILPDSIADRLKAEPDETIADSCTEASVLFADLVGFTPVSRELGAEKIVDLLNDIFTRFDRIAVDLKVEKIKTIGDAYMAVAGLPNPQEDHTERVASMALRMIEAIETVARERGLELDIRIGVETGPVMAGVIGRSKFFYDVWGDTVNMASRLESHGQPGRIHVSADVMEKLSENFNLEPRGAVDIKGVGKVETWFLTEEYLTKLEETG